MIANKMTYPVIALSVFRSRILMMYDGMGDLSVDLHTFTFRIYHNSQKRNNVIKKYNKWLKEWRTK